MQRVGFLWLPSGARALIAREALRFRLRETGGPLFGYISQDDLEVVVTRAFGPGPAANHERERIVPDRTATQRAIDLVDAESDGQDRYLGEWHTHLLGPARPSGHDLIALSHLAHDTGLDLPHPVALIQSLWPVGGRWRLRELAAYRWWPDLTRRLIVREPPAT